MRRLTFALDYQDLRQAAMFGLAQADQRLPDSIPPGEFVTAASVRIRGEILDECRRARPGARHGSKKPHKPRVTDPAAVATARATNMLPDVTYDSDGTLTTLATGATAEEQLITNETSRQLREVLEVLPRRLRDIMRWKLDGDTQETVALRLGVTEARVSQLVAMAIKVLRAGRSPLIQDELRQ